MHVSYFGQVERRQRNIAFHNILRLSISLGVQPGELLDGLSDPDAPPPKSRARRRRQ